MDFLRHVNLAVIWRGERLEALLMSCLSLLITTGQEMKGGEERCKKKWCGEIRVERINEGRGVEDERRRDKKQRKGDLVDERREKREREKKRYESRGEKQEVTKMGKEEGADERITDKRAGGRADSLPPHSHVTQFTMFWPIMFYSTITDSTVVSSDLISQPISFGNVNTKGEAEPLAASSSHLLLLMHNWLPW